MVAIESIIFIFSYSTLGLIYFIFGYKWNPPQDDDEMADHVIVSILWPLGAIINLLSNTLTAIDYLANGKVSKSLAKLGFKFARLFN